MALLKGGLSTKRNFPKSIPAHKILTCSVFMNDLIRQPLSFYFYVRLFQFNKRLMHCQWTLIFRKKVVHLIRTFRQTKEFYDTFLFCTLKHVPLVIKMWFLESEESSNIVIKLSHACTHVVPPIIFRTLTPPCISLLRATLVAFHTQSVISKISAEVMCFIHEHPLSNLVCLLFC